MADTPPHDVSFEQIVETARSVWQALVAPTGLAVAGAVWAGYQWLSNRRDVRRKELLAIDDGRGKRIEAEAAAEAAERSRLEGVNADQVRRLLEEIARKDTEIAVLKKSDQQGWEGLFKCHVLLDRTIHDANSNQMVSNATMDRARVPRPVLRPILEVLPDIDTLAGRNGTVTIKGTVISVEPTPKQIVAPRPASPGAAE